MSTETGQPTSHIVVRVGITVGIYALVAAVILIVLNGEVDIFKRVGGWADANHGGDLGQFQNAVDSVRTPANATLGSAAGLGLAGGGIAAAAGHPMGMQIMGRSALGGLLVLIGNGVVA